jgi:hypothetical protein
MTARVLVPGLALLFGLLSGHAAPGQEPRRQPAKPPAVEHAPRAVIQVFTLRDTDAAEMIQTLKDLFAGDNTRKTRLALHRSTNSLVATGTEEDLDRINAIIARLETAAGDKKKDAGKGAGDEREKQLEAARQKVALAEADLEQTRERAAWSERMVKLNYLTATQATAERARLESAREKLQLAKRELAALEAAQDKPKAAAGVVWEYKVVKLGLDEDDWEAALNKVGPDGWELVAPAQMLRARQPAGTVLLFKRPKR